jgi:hypothetical protein
MEIIRPTTPKPYKYVGHSTHRKYVDNMYRKRSTAGIYVPDDTLSEAVYNLSTVEKTDIGITLNQRIGRFTTFNWVELAPVVADWRRLKCVALPCNMREVHIADWEGDVRSAWMVIVQPPADREDECPLISALAIACNTLVSGMAYLFKNKSDAERIISSLKQD